MAKQYQEEFPDFHLWVAIPEGFEDTSWHNDTYPSQENEELQLKLWIDYDNKENREVFSMPQYSIQHIDGDNIECSDDYNLILKEIQKISNI